MKSLAFLVAVVVVVRALARGKHLYPGALLSGLAAFVVTAVAMELPGTLLSVLLDSATLPCLLLLFIIVGAGWASYRRQRAGVEKWLAKGATVSGLKRRTGDEP